MNHLTDQSCNKLIACKFILDGKLTSDFIALYLYTDTDQCYMIFLDDEDYAWKIIFSDERPKASDIEGDQEFKYIHEDITEKYNLSGNRILEFSESDKDALPKAGRRAKAIKGIYHGLRNHLNEHASHSSYSHYSLSHLLTPELEFRKVQQFVPKVIDNNFKNLSVQVWLICYEAALTLECVLPKDKMEELAIAADDLKERMMHAFELSPPNQPIQPTPDGGAADG